MAKDYELYCDGAYSSSRNQGGVGLVILKEGQLIREYSRMYKNTTNIKMELLALIHGLMSFTKPIDSLTIYTDSMYCIGCASGKWQRKANLEYWALFDKVAKKFKSLCPQIKFIHVKGHEGNQWNEYVDRLAVAASKEV